MIPKIQVHLHAKVYPSKIVFCMLKFANFTIRWKEIRSKWKLLNIQILDVLIFLIQRSVTLKTVWRTVWRFLKKLEIELLYDPAIPLLGIHTKETRIERDTCTPMFIAALFIMARTWKQPRCSSADEWIRKLWYIYIMEYYSVIRKNTFESVLMRWMNLEPIIQSEVSQKEKHQYSILTHIYGI